MSKNEQMYFYVYRDLSTVKSLGPIRGRVRQVDISFNKDGKLLVATSNGDPRCPVRIFSLLPRLEDDLCGDESLSSKQICTRNRVTLKLILYN